MSEKALMLTLGHGSSALFFDGNNSVGYEQERLDGVKSSSVFPRDSIEMIASKVDLTGANLLISHWYDNFDLDLIDYEKHIDKRFLSNLIEKYNMNTIYLSDEFTHHDAHAYSSLSFVLNNVTYEKVKEFNDRYFYFVVADGFGNKQEVVSVYRCLTKHIVDIEKRVELELVHRTYGYENSLGLMYQYATSYCDMKENQDEYKFLGYESHIEDVLTNLCIAELDKFVSKFSKTFFDRIIKSVDRVETEKLCDSFINTTYLSTIKTNWYNVFNSVIDDFDVDSDFDKRVIIGYFIQGVIEKVLSMLVQKFDIHNIGLSGGIFYNVKLNNSILSNIDGLFSVIPLAGDQGAAIGIYQKFISNFNFNDLCYGDRGEISDSDLKLLVEEDGVFVFNDRENFVKCVGEFVLSNNIVNMIEGNMEFGPRALCHTSTIALPNSKNVDHINALNKRNTVMPMAPVMLEEDLEFFFDEHLYSRVLGSDRFMIVTYDYKKHINKDVYRGVMHKYPTINVYSGRPQIVKYDDGKLIKNILEYVKKNDIQCLINTSFNVHGNPILFSYRNILEDFRFQCIMAQKLNIERPYLVIYVQ